MVANAIVCFILDTVYYMYLNILLSYLIFMLVLIYNVFIICLIHRLDLPGLK